ncbi:MAG: tetratricopeptide repeat protein [Candidatus Hermodarchaeota archaeon]
MPQSTKTKVCSETDNRKAEIFNHIDDLITRGFWDKALDDLQYLFRNAPSLRSQVHLKLAWLYYEMKNFYQALAHLQTMIPSREVYINRMIIDCLLKIDKKDVAIFHLARTPLKLPEKRNLFFLIFPELQESFNVKRSDHWSSQINIRCPRCTQFLFFTQKRLKCLFCE